MHAAYPLTVGADWAAFWGGGPNVVFGVLAGLQLLYSSHGPCNIAGSEWVMWVQDVTWAFFEMILQYELYFLNVAGSLTLP